MRLHFWNILYLAEQNAIGGIQYQRSNIEEKLEKKKSPNPEYHVEIKQEKQCLLSSYLIISKTKTYMRYFLDANRNKFILEN